MESENLSREWALDHRASEIWDGLKLIERDPTTGLAMLEDLGRSGSALSMMYVGHAYLTGQYGTKIDQSQGEEWLRKSFTTGSIEGGYRLAKYLQSVGRDSDAMTTYLRLSELGYAPASYQIGVEHYLGQKVDKDITKALHYLKIGKDLGHLPSIHWMSYVKIRTGGTIFNKFTGYVMRIRHLILMIYLSLASPNSDRLRR